MTDPITRLQIYGQDALMDKVLSSSVGYPAQNLLLEYQSSGWGTLALTPEEITLTLLGIRATAGMGRNRHSEELFRPTSAAALRAWQHAARDRMTHPGVTA